MSNNQQGQGGKNPQQGNNAGQQDKTSQQNQAGRQGQQGGKSGQQTPNGGVHQQEKASGGQNEHGSNIKDKHQGQQAQSGQQGQQGAAQSGVRQPSQQGSDNHNRGSSGEKR